MQRIEKRVYDSRRYDLIASDCLRPNEVVTSVSSMTSDDPSIIFGTASVNSAPVTYPDGATFAAGTVIQVQISGGTVLAGTTVRIAQVFARFATNIDPQVEGVFQMNIRG